MAKLSANGNHKVGQVNVETTGGRSVFALRSDGYVLRRTSGYFDKEGEFHSVSSSYSVYGKLNGAGSRKFTNADVERLAKILKIKGFRKVEIK